MTAFTRKPLSLSFFLILSAFFSSDNFAQNLDIELLGNELAKKISGSAQTITTSGDDQYESYIKNQYSNTAKQLSNIGEEIEEDLFLSKLQKDRLELASKLCSKDPRSCFLIDEYQEYLNETIPSNEDELEIFGLDIFSSYPTSINSYESMPISDEYVLKPGDEITINITGSLNISEELEVSPSGVVSISEVGDIPLAGFSVKDASDNLDKFVKSRYLGAETFLNVGKLTLNQVFSLGAVRFPGSYNISPLSSVINSLISSGGFKENASLRTIQIIRDNLSIQTVDLYNFLIYGKTNLDWQLRSGDAILVNGTSNHVSILGEINRPAIYEIMDGESLTDLIDFALGVTPFADLERITIKRINSEGNFELLNVDINTPTKLLPGDSIEVNSKQGDLVDLVTIHGSIKPKGGYKHYSGMKLGELISLEQDLLDSTYTLFGAGKRFDKSTRSYSIFYFDLMNQSYLNSILLEPKDEIFIFSKDDINFINSKSLRDGLNSISNSATDTKSQSFTSLSISDFSESLESGIEKKELFNKPPNTESFQKCFSSVNSIKNDDVQKNLVNKLNFFNSLNSFNCSEMLQEFPELLPILLANSIPVLGNVRHPGLVPVSKNISFNAVFNFAGGLNNSNFSSYAEVASYGQEAVSFEIDNPPNINRMAYVNIKTRENIFHSKFVTLVGEFISPGVYPINSNTTLLDIFERAGGLTPQAHPFGAIFSRDRIKRSEMEALIRTQSELTELMTGAVASGYLKQSPTDLIPLISLITNLENAEPKGRLVTELDPRKIKQNPNLNIFLENGDVIYMPKMNSTITVSGSILNPVTVPYIPGKSFNYYIEIAGGYKSNANKSKVYAIKPNGESILAQKSFSFFKNDAIVPGTTIIVPSKVRVFDGLALVETITPVLANLSVTAASIAAISNNN